MTDIKVPRIPITIRPTIKTFDEMTLKSPINWNVKLLRSILHEHHLSIKSVYSLDKLAFVFRGRRLEDAEVVEELWQQAGSPDTLVFYLQIVMPTLANQQSGSSQQNKKPEFEIKNESRACEQEIKAILTEKSLLKDYFRKIQFLIPEGSENDSNIKNLGFINSLPLMTNEFTQKIKSVNRKIEEREKFSLYNKSNEANTEIRNPGPNNNAANPDQNPLVDRYYHLKLITKIVAFCFFFGNYFKGPLMILLAIVLFYYYRIELKENERRNRLLAATQANQQEANANSEQKKKRKPLWLKVNVMKTSQMISCLFLSLFPSWSVEMYLDSESVKKEVEEIMLYYEPEKEAPEPLARPDENIPLNKEDVNKVLSPQANGSSPQTDGTSPEPMLGPSEQPMQDPQKTEMDLGLIQNFIDKERIEPGRREPNPAFLNSILADDTIDHTDIFRRIFDRERELKREDLADSKDRDEKNDLNDDEWVDED